MGKGVLGTRLSLTQFRFAETWPEDSLARVQQKAFRDIDDSFEEMSVGWVSSRDLFCPPDQCFFDGNTPGIVFSMRVDLRKISGSVLRKLVTKEEAAAKIRLQVPKLPKGTRNEIKDRVRTTLLRKAIPDAVDVDVFIDTRNQLVSLNTTNARLVETFEELFLATFNIRLLPQVLPTRLQHLLSDSEYQAFDMLTPNLT